MPFDPLESLPDDAALWGEVPLDLMVRFTCVPVGRSGGRLVLAFGGLDDVTRVDDLEFLLGRPIDAVVAPEERVSELLKRHRGGEMLLEQASESLRLQLVADDETETVEHDAVGEPDRPPRGLAADGRHRPSGVRHPHRDEGPRGPGQVSDRRRPLPGGRASRQAPPRHDPEPDQGHVGAGHRREAHPPGRALPAAREGAHHRLPRLDHAVDPRRGRGHPHPGQGIAELRVPEPAPRRAGLLGRRPPAPPQVQHRALRDAGGHRADREAGRRRPCTPRCRRSRPPKTRSSPSRTPSSTRSRSSPRSPSTRRRGSRSRAASGRSCATTPTRSWWARCATRRPPRSRSSPP